MSNRDKLLAAVKKTDAAVRAARDEVGLTVERRATALRKAHEAGITWVDLGKALGVTGARAQQAARPRDDQTARRRKSS